MVKHVILWKLKDEVVDKAAYPKTSLRWRELQV